ncbi:hypothetical protein ACFL35_05560 [Candidatus Riflebacteria bacterium]
MWQKPSGKKGSVVLIAAGILCVVFLVYFAFMQTLSGIGRLTVVLSQHNIALNLANDLALLGGFIIQKSISQADSGDALGNALVTYLTKPLNKWNPTFEMPFNLPPAYNGIRDKLLAPLSKNLKVEILNSKIQVLCSDFKPLSHTQKKFEKSGFLRLLFTIQINKKIQTFNFTFPVDVVLPLPGILKRFVLWIENAVAPSGMDYNMLSQNQSGLLMPGSGIPKKPLVIKSYPYNPGTLALVDAAFIYDNCGFIYLGGNKDIKLNLGNGFSEAGESRHLYFKNPTYPQAKNLYTCMPLSTGKYWIRFRDGGFDYEESSALKSGADPLSLWLTYYMNSLYGDWKKSTLSSTLKLYGLEGNAGCSNPTLVIGRVYRRYIRQSSWRHKQYNSMPAIRKKPAGIGVFYFPGTNTEFTNMLTDATDPFNIASVSAALGISSGNFGQYKSRFASRVVTEPYNIGVDFIVTKGMKTDPPAIIPANSSYKKIQPGRPVPAYFPTPSFQPDTRLPLKLTSIVPQIPIKATYAISSGSQFSRFLSWLGKIFGNVLDLNSVVLVEKGGVVLKDLGSPYRLKSTGVIVSIKGNITIKRGIIKNRNRDHYLGLVAMNGNIIIDTDEEIDAVLICNKGNIIYNKPGKLKVYGGILSRRLFSGKRQFKKLFEKGGWVEYDHCLAMPLTEANARKMLLISTSLKPRTCHGG